MRILTRSFWMSTAVLCLLTGHSLSSHAAHAAVRLTAPLAAGQISSPFGWRTDPMVGTSRFHGGLDIAAPMGAPVYATQAGRIAFSGPYHGYGNVVVIDHGNTLYTLYAHNSELFVQAGQVIQQGQCISRVGSTGRSTGPHLHFEVHYNQRYVDPLVYFGVKPMPADIAVGRPQAPVQRATGAHADRQLAQAAAPSVGMRTGGKNHATVQLVSGASVNNVEF